MPFALREVLSWFDGGKPARYNYHTMGGKKKLFLGPLSKFGPTWESEMAVNGQKIILSTQNGSNSYACGGRVGVWVGGWGTLFKQEGCFQVIWCKVVKILTLVGIASFFLFLKLKWLRKSFQRCRREQSLFISWH